MDKKKLASYIDHTLLKASSQQEEIRSLCSEAKQWNFASVCVNPIYVAMAAQELKDSDVKVCTVVGFPLGATPTAVKAYETTKAIEDGADEIDMVLAVGKMKDGQHAYVLEDVKAVVKAAQGKLVKVILETCYLDRDEIAKACEICQQGGADFVKTSTGFGTGGATVDDVALMHKTVPAMQVKASGGVRSLEDAMAMIDAGATRLGTSSGIALMQGEGNAKSDSAY